MALSKKMMEKPQPEREALGEEENVDVEIAEALGSKLMSTPEAQQLLQEASQGQGDPAAKVGVFFAQMIGKLQEKMENTPVPLSPRIWLSQNGVVDRWVEDLSEDGLLPEGIGDAVKEEIANILKLQKGAMEGGGQQVPQQEQGPPQPQQAPQQPMMGGM